MYDEASCEELLWMLRDEPASPAHPSSLPELAPDLRIFVVSGAFGDCHDLDTIPFGDAIQRLSSRGVKIEAVMVSGRSGTEHNSRQIAATIRAAGIEPGDRIVLIGYSKGAVDILQFLADFPQLGQQVVSVMSVAGAIFGSPLASQADWSYRTLFAGAFSESATRATDWSPEACCPTRADSGSKNTRSPGTSRTSRSPRSRLRSTSARR